MNKRIRNRLILVIPVLLIIVLAISFLFKDTEDGMLTGVKYIKKEEALSTKKLQKTLTTRKEKEQKDLVEAGLISVFDRFQDYVIYGDSRACGFTDNGFLPSSRVFAQTGDDVTDIPKWQSHLEALKPTNIYFAYGMNEVSSAILDQGIDYRDEYTKNVRQVVSVLPESNIYICSIIPVSASLLAESDTSYNDVDEYNQILKTICEENGWTFIDMGDYSLYDTYYESDGIHFKPEFYNIWAEAMIEGTKQ